MLLEYRVALIVVVLMYSSAQTAWSDKKIRPSEFSVMSYGGDASTVDASTGKYKEEQETHQEEQGCHKQIS